MEVHLVHADQEGKAAVVAVLLQKGEDTLWSTNYGTTYQGKEKEEFLNSVRSP